MDLPADKEQAAMIDRFTVQHCEHVSQRSFENLVAAFEAELGSVEDPAIISREVAAATSQADFEARIRAYEGRSGFMRDDSPILEWEGRRRRSKEAAPPSRAILYVPAMELPWTSLNHPPRLHGRG
jgi:hypothetical protein